MDFTDILIVLSLSLTAIYACYAVETMSLWYKTFKESLGKYNPSDRLAKGIFGGFLASLVDSLYWAIAWATVYYDTEVGLLLVLMGNLPNIFSRQLGGIYAARQHALAATEFNKLVRPVWLRVTYWLFGFIVGLVLIYTGV